MLPKTILFTCALLLIYSSEVHSNNISFSEALVQPIGRPTACDIRGPVHTDVELLLNNGRNCKITNRGFNDFNEYLFAADDYGNSQLRRVATGVAGNPHLVLWNLEISAGDVYKIKSVKFDEYLYAGSDRLKVDGVRRQVFTWKPKTRCEEQCYWDIQLVRQPAGATDHYFTIRNVEFGEYLKAPVYTWKYDPYHNVKVDCQSQWKIYCE